MSLTLVFVVSIIAGLVGSMTGLGGGVVLIPVLTWYGIDIKHAIALSMMSVIAVSTGAASTYVRKHLTNLKISAFLELFAVLGALAGAAFTITSGRPILFFLCGMILFGSSVLLWKHREQPWSASSRPDRFARQIELEGSYYDAVERRTIAYRGTRAVESGLFMTGTGFIAGLLGIGSSALTVLVLDGVMGLPPKVSMTTSNLIIGVVALAGASLYLEAGLIDPALVAPVILGVLVGAFLGARWVLRFSNQRVRRIFLIALAIFGLEMILHALGRI